MPCVITLQVLRLLPWHHKDDLMLGGISTLGRVKLPHRHSGQISGVLYLKVPNDMSVGVNPGNNKALNAGSICFTEGSGNYYKRWMANRVPRVGDMYIFPSDLLHTVYPFFGDDERRSFSFNFAINL